MRSTACVCVCVAMLCAAAAAAAHTHIQVERLWQTSADTKRGPSTSAGEQSDTTRLLSRTRRPYARTELFVVRRVETGVETGFASLTKRTSETSWH